MSTPRDPFLAFTAGYLFFSFCFICPPQPLKAVGFTVQGIFSSLLGREGVHFVKFHVVRTTLTLACHAVIVLGYVGITATMFLYDELVAVLMDPYGAAALNVFLVVMGAAVSGAAVMALAISAFWARAGWKHHPVVKQLTAYEHRGPWQVVAQIIDVDFRCVDKVVATIGSCTVVVTDSWILQLGTYTLNIAHQEDVDLSIASQYDIPSMNEHERVQVLTIKVTSIRRGIPPFELRLDSLHYNEIQSRIRNRIRNAQNIMIRMSLSDQFLETLKDVVNLNPRYSNLFDEDRCVGCLTNPASVKIFKYCDNEAHSPCFCRPMWCLACLSKWFVSNQEQSLPSTWLNGTASCPTCRAVFCTRDIAYLG